MTADVDGAACPVVNGRGITRRRAVEKHGTADDPVAVGIHERAGDITHARAVAQDRTIADGRSTRAGRSVKRDRAAANRIVGDDGVVAPAAELVVDAALIAAQCDAIVDGRAAGARAAAKAQRAAANGVAADGDVAATELVSDTSLGAAQRHTIDEGRAAGAGGAVEAERAAAKGVATDVDAEVGVVESIIIANSVAPIAHRDAVIDDGVASAGRVVEAQRAAAEYVAGDADVTGEVAVAGIVAIADADGAAAAALRHAVSERHAAGVRAAVEAERATAEQLIGEVVGAGASIAVADARAGCVVSDAVGHGLAGQRGIGQRNDAGVAYRVGKRAGAGHIQGAG